MTTKKKILLIDDDKDFLFATKLIIEKAGYEVFMAENGKTGMEMWESVMPDLVIIDMMMETWGEGFSVLKKIRATDAGQNTPLFMLSAVDLQGAYGSYEPPLEFPKLNRVLHKPIKAEELLGHIAQELKNK